MTISKKAQKYYDQFELKKRGDDDDAIVVFKDSRSEALYNSVMEAHGDLLPNDWIFSTYRGILGSIADYDIDSMDNLDEVRSEIVDGLVDPYTSDLTDWLGSNNSNVYYLSEALEEFDTKDGFEALQLAQNRAIDEVFNYVLDLLN